MKWLREMLRRRMVPVLLTYGALAWSAHEFFERVLPAYGLPDALVRASGYIAMLGLIPVSLFAWRSRLTSQGIQRDVRPSVEPVAPHLLNRWQLGIVTAGALAAAGAVTFLLQTPRIDLYGSQNQGPVQSLAVLPFEGMESDEGIFANGLTEVLLGSTGQIPGLKVAAKDSVQAARLKRMTPAQSAAALAVNAVLTGTVRRNMDRVQIQARLVDGRTGQSLWARDFDREAGQIFEIQDEIATSVAKAMKVQFVAGAPADGGIGTRSLPALEAYWRGIHQFQAKTRVSMDGALEQFQLAARLDPGFGEAETQIARTLLHRMMWLGVGDPPQVISDSERHIAAALRLSPRLVEAYETQAEILAVKGPATGMPNWYGEAQIALARALRINPNRSSTYSIGATVAFRNRNFADVARAYKRAIEVDPLAPGLHVDYARILTRMQRGAESLAQLQQAMSLDPEYADAYYAAAEYQGSAGARLDLAARNAQRARQLDPNSPLYAMMLISTLTDLDELDRAVAVARETEIIGVSNFFWIRAVVQLHALRHDWSAARDILRKFEGVSPTNREESMKLFESHVLATGGEPAAVAALMARASTQWPGLFAESPRIGSQDESIAFPHVLKLAAMAKDQVRIDRLGKMIRGMLPEKPSPEELLTLSGDASLIDIYALLGDATTAWNLLRASVGDPPKPTVGWSVLRDPELAPAARALQDNAAFRRWLQDLEAQVLVQRQSFSAEQVAEAAPRR